LEFFPESGEGNAVAEDRCGNIRWKLEGIVEGLRARTGSKLDVYDIVAFNAFEELPDY